MNELTLDHIPTKTVFLINRDNPDAWSLALKLSGPHKPGAIIPLTDGEFRAMKSDCLHIKIEE